MQLKKSSLLIVYLLIVQAFLTPAFVAHSEQFEVNTLADMLNKVEAIDIEFGGDASQEHYSYRVLGTETINLKQTWKVETQMGELGSEESYTIWVEKATGKTLQVDLDGQIMADMMAEVYGNITLSFFTGFVYSYWQAWPIEDFQNWGSDGFGETTYLGKETQTFGETSLDVYGFRYEGYVYGDETVNYVTEIWYAPTSFGGIATSMQITAGTDVINLELKSIKLVENQQISNDFLQLIEGITSGGSEPEPEPEPANIVYQSVNLSPSSVTSGGQVTVTVSIENTGDQPASEPVKLFINDQLIETKTVTVEGKTTVSVDFTYTSSSAGSYTVKAGSSSKTLTVTGAESEPEPEAEAAPGFPWWIILILIIILALVLYLYKREKDKKNIIQNA